MEGQKPNMWKSAMQQGAIVGGVLSVYSLIVFFLGGIFENWFAWVSYLILIAGIIYSTKQYRQNSLGGYIMYGQALGYSVLLVMFSSIVYAFFFYVFIKFIHPEFISEMLLEVEDQLIEMGVPDEQIEKTVSMQRRYVTPGIYSLSIIPTYVFMGTIFGLITSIFLKKASNNPFD